MRRWVGWWLTAAALAIGAGRGTARAQDAISFGLDWRAEAEHGGYYQALATGIYARYGLRVTLRQGGPQVNQMPLLLAGRLQFALAPSSFLPLNFAAQALPLQAVAAMFQQDPAVLLAHPGTGNDTFEALRGKPIAVGADARAGWWPFLRARFGYTDAQLRPYAGSLAPFLADPHLVQQGYLGSEPLLIRESAGFDPVVLPLADAGFHGYASLIVTGTDTIRDHPDLVQRFIDASAEGWRSFLDGDPAPADALIKRDNPEMTDALLAFGRDALKRHGIVESGDAATLGIGAMTDARWDGFFRSVASGQPLPSDTDRHRAYTLRFVDHRPAPPAAAPR